ncbi:malate/lactate/ureidoglycolate dehydrogenase [Acuticoccus sp.]|uniref:malate/lactate/ureidoglycolate dehydrogenase n=1 Tax=Acuticoccus sp. TaxID=1904378 RepID=UPI003B517435
MIPSVAVEADALRDVAREAMARCGSPADEADAVADHLVEANLKGHDSHGVVRLPRYRTMVETGALAVGATLTVVADTGPLLQLDANRGMGQWLARQATDRAIARAHEHGVAVLALRRAGHVGRLGAYAEQACAAGLVSIHFVNVAGSKLVAPFGAAGRMTSTNPIAIGVVRADGEPFILDFATSMIAEGKALVAAQGGTTLPDGALVDGAGQPTADPAALYGPTLGTPGPDPRGGPGALAAFGLHKGSGLALACELLGGALTGNGANGPDDQPFGNGMLSILVDPRALDTAGTFATDAEAFLARVEAMTPAAGTATVLTPGMKERATRDARMADGIPLPHPLWEALRRLAEAPPLASA